MLELLSPYRIARLQMEELLAVAGKSIRRLAADVADGRVAAELDLRTLRYYQTLGLLDKPDRYEGRRAIYGYRHLLQLVCIKQLQAAGYPLALIQERLTGRTTAQLEAAICDVTNSSAPVSLPPEPLTATAPLLAAEVAPGVTIVIDPARVPEPQDVLNRIGSMLGQRKV